MSSPDTATRLALCGFPSELETPAPSATRARVDAASAGRAPGPTSPAEAWHRVHYRSPMSHSGRRPHEIRVTSTPGFLWVKVWIRNDFGEWWPVRDGMHLRIDAPDVGAFADAVTRAAALLVDATKGRS